MAVVKRDFITSILAPLREAAGAHHAWPIPSIRPSGVNARTASAGIRARRTALPAPICAAHCSAAPAVFVRYFPSFPAARAPARNAPVAATSAASAALTPRKNVAVRGALTTDRAASPAPSVGRLATANMTGSKSLSPFVRSDTFRAIAWTSLSEHGGHSPNGSRELSGSPAHPTRACPPRRAWRWPSR